MSTAYAPTRVPRATGTPRLRLTRRGRVVITLAAGLPFALGAAFSALNGGDAVATADQRAVDFSYVTVESGQSLWAIAEQVAPQVDPREVVDDIIGLNGLDDAAVQPGQRIAVPVAYAAD